MCAARKRMDPPKEASNASAALGPPSPLPPDVVEAVEKLLAAAEIRFEAALRVKSDCALLKNPSLPMC